MSQLFDIWQLLPCMNTKYYVVLPQIAVNLGSESESMMDL